MYHLKSNIKDTLRYFAKHWVEAIGIIVGVLFAIVYTIYYYELNHQQDLPFTKPNEKQMPAHNNKEVSDTINITNGFIRISTNTISD